MLEANEGRVQEALHKDIGKGLFETILTEFFFVNDELKAAIKGVEEWARPKPVDTDMLNKTHETHET